MYPPFERSAGDSDLREVGNTSMRTPEEISEFCSAAVHGRMLAAADHVIERYKQALKGSKSGQQIALTRAMLEVRNRRAALAADDRVGSAAALWEFTALAVAPLPGVPLPGVPLSVARTTAGSAVPAPRPAPRSGR